MNLLGEQKERNKEEISKHIGKEHEKNKERWFINQIQSILKRKEGSTVRRLVTLSRIF